MLAQRLAKDLPVLRRSWYKLVLQDIWYSNRITLEGKSMLVTSLGMAVRLKQGGFWGSGKMGGGKRSHDADNDRCRIPEKSIRIRP